MGGEGNHKRRSEKRNGSRLAQNKRAVRVSDYDNRIRSIWRVGDGGVYIECRDVLSEKKELENLKGFLS